VVLVTTSVDVALFSNGTPSVELVNSGVVVTVLLSSGTTSAVLVTSGGDVALLYNRTTSVGLATFCLDVALHLSNETTSVVWFRCSFIGSACISWKLPDKVAFGKTTYDCRCDSIPYKGITIEPLVSIWDGFSE
jgi:hypothetical protein